MISFSLRFPVSQFIFSKGLRVTFLFVLIFANYSSMPFSFDLDSASNNQTNIRDTSINTIRKGEDVKYEKDNASLEDSISDYVKVVKSKKC